MFQKVFHLTGDRPVDDISRLMKHLRESERDHEVTFGAPPFERNWCDQITAVRLRFVPRAEGASANSSRAPA